MNDIDKIGKQAAKLLQEDATAKKTTRKANADRVAKMRPLLQQVWDALDRGETVNGCTTKKDWVEENSTVTQRNIEYILAGGNKNRPTKRNVSRVVLKPGTVFEIDGWVFEIPQKREDDSDSLTSISKPWDRDLTPGNPYFGQKYTNVTLHDVRLVEDKNAKREPKKKERLKPSDSRSNFRPRHSNQKTHATNPDTSGTYCGLGGGTLRVKDKDTKPTCKKCAKAWSEIKAISDMGTDREVRVTSDMSTAIRVKLTEAQAREVNLTKADDTLSIYLKGGLLVFHGNYEESAKALVLKLEQRIETLTAEADEQRKTLLDFNDKSPENKTAFNEQKRLQGSIEACRHAMRAIGYSSDALVAWYEQRENEQFEAELAAPIYTVTCLTCGNQRTTDESNTLVTLPSNGAQNAARNHCEKCGAKASVYDRKKFDSKPVGWQPKHTTPQGKEIVTITHIYGGATAGGGQNTRMHSYALCGRNFTPRSQDGVTVPASGRIHESVLHGETPTCPECLELSKKDEQPTETHPAAQEMEKALAAAASLPAGDRAWVEGMVADIRAGRERESACPDNEEEAAESTFDAEGMLQVGTRVRENPACDPNADDEFAGERD